MRASFRQLLGVCFGLTALCGTARGDLLNLTFLPEPDFMASFIDVTYDAASDAFLASGFTSQLNGTDLDATDGLFSISATIDGSGVLGTGGTLSIGGAIGGAGPSLLTGDLTDFGFRPIPGGDPFEFLFDVTGGDLAGLFGGIGAQGGIILSAFGGFDGSFASSFDNLMDFGFGSMAGTGLGVADVALIPEPASIMLGMIGMGMIAGVRRRFS